MESLGRVNPSPPHKKNKESPVCLLPFQPKHTHGIGVPRNQLSSQIFFGASVETITSQLDHDYMGKSTIDHIYMVESKKTMKGNGMREGFPIRTVRNRRRTNQYAATASSREQQKRAPRGWSRAERGSSNCLPHARARPCGWEGSKHGPWGSFFSQLSAAVGRWFPTYPEAAWGCGGPNVNNRK